MDDPKLITNSTGDQKGKMTSVSPPKRPIVLGVVNTTGMKSTNLNRKRRWDQPPEEVSDMPCVKKVHLSDCPVSEIESPETSPCINPALDRISDVNSDLTTQCDILNSNESMSSAEEFLSSDNVPCEEDITSMEVLPNSNDRLSNAAEDSCANVLCSEQIVNECESTVQEEKSFEFSESISDNKVNSCSPQLRLGISNPSGEVDTSRPVNNLNKIVTSNNSSTIISHQSDELRRIMSSYNESSSDSNTSDTVSSSNVGVTNLRLDELQSELKNTERKSEKDVVSVPSSQTEKVSNERLPFADSITHSTEDSLDSNSQPLLNEKNAFTDNVLSPSSSSVNENIEPESHNNIPNQKDVDVVSNKETSNSDDDYLSTTQSPFMNENEEFQNCLESNPDLENSNEQCIKNLEKESEILVQTKCQNKKSVQEIQCETADGVSSSEHIPQSSEHKLLNEDVKSEIKDREDNIVTDTHSPENIDVYDRGKEHANERNFDNAQCSVSSLTFTEEKSSVDLKVFEDAFDVCVKKLSDEVNCDSMVAEYNEKRIENNNSESCNRIDVIETVSPEKDSPKIADSNTLGSVATAEEANEMPIESFISKPKEVRSTGVIDVELNEQIYSDSTDAPSNIIKDSTIEMNYSNDFSSSNSLRSGEVKVEPLDDPVSSSSLLSEISIKNYDSPDACSIEKSDSFETPLVNNLKEDLVADDLEKSFDSSPLNNNHMLPAVAKDIVVDRLQAPFLHSGNSMKEISEKTLTSSDEQKSNSSSEDIITPSIDQSEKSSINVTSSKHIDPEVMEIIFGSSSGLSRVVGNEADEECLSVPSADLDSNSETNIRLSQPNSPLGVKEDSPMEIEEEKINSKSVLIATDDIDKNQKEVPTSYLMKDTSKELFDKSDQMEKDETQLHSSEISETNQGDSLSTFLKVQDSSTCRTPSILAEESLDDNQNDSTSNNSNGTSDDGQLKGPTLADEKISSEIIFKNAVDSFEKVQETNEVINVQSEVVAKDKDTNERFDKTSDIQTVDSVPSQCKFSNKAETEEIPIEADPGISAPDDNKLLETDAIVGNTEEHSSGCKNKDESFIGEFIEEVVVPSGADNVSVTVPREVGEPMDLETPTATISETAKNLGTEINLEESSQTSDYLNVEKVSKGMVPIIEEAIIKSDAVESTIMDTEPENISGVFDSAKDVDSTEQIAQDEVVGTRIISGEIESTEDMETMTIAAIFETSNERKPETSKDIMNGSDAVSATTSEVIETTVIEPRATKEIIEIPEEIAPENNSEVLETTEDEDYENVPTLTPVIVTETSQDVQPENKKTSTPAEVTKASENVESGVLSKIVSSNENVRPETSDNVKAMTTPKVIEDSVDADPEVISEIKEITSDVNPQTISKVLEDPRTVDLGNAIVGTSEGVKSEIKDKENVEPEKFESTIALTSAEVIEASENIELETIEDEKAVVISGVIGNIEDTKINSRAERIDTPDIKMSGIPSEDDETETEVEDAVPETSDVIIEVNEVLETPLTSDLMSTTENVLPITSSEAIATTDELGLDVTSEIIDITSTIDHENDSRDIIENVHHLPGTTSGKVILASESLTELISSESDPIVDHEVSVNSKYVAVVSDDKGETAVEVVEASSEVSKALLSEFDKGSPAVKENTSGLEKSIAIEDRSAMNVELLNEEELRCSDEKLSSKEEESSVQLNSENSSLQNICENQKISVAFSTPDSSTENSTKLAEKKEKPIDFISDVTEIEDDFKETPDIQPSYSTELNEILDESKDFVERMDIADSVPLLSDEANLEPVESSLVAIEDEVLIDETKSSDIEITARINSPIEESSEISFEPIVNEGTKGLTEDIESYDVVEEVVTCESPESDKILENELEDIIDEDDDDDARSPSLASEETLETVHESVANSDQLEAVIENDTSDLKESDIDNQNEVFIESEVCIGTDSFSSDVLLKDSTEANKGLLENKVITNSISSDFPSRKRDCGSTVNSITKPKASFMDEAMEIDECDDDSPPEIKKRKRDSDLENTSFSAVINTVKIDSKVLKEKVSSDIPLLKTVSSPLMQKHEILQLKSDEAKSFDKVPHSGEPQLQASKMEPITLRLYKDNLSIKTDDLDSPKRKSPKLSSETRSQLSPLPKGSDSKCSLSPQTKQLEFTLKIAKDASTNQTKATMSPKSNMSPSSSWKLDPGSPSPSSPADSGFNPLKLKISKPGSPVQIKEPVLFEKTIITEEHDVDSLHLPKQSIEIGSVLKKIMESEKSEIKKESSILEKALSNSAIETPNAIIKKRGRPRKTLPSTIEIEGNPMNHSPSDPLDSPSLDTSGESSDQASSRQVRSCRARTLPIVVKTRKPRGGGVGRGGGRGGAKGVARPITSEKEAEKIQEKLSEHEKAELAKIEARKEKMRLDRLAKNEAKKAKKLAKKLKDEERRKRIAAEKAEKAAAAAPQVFEEETRMSAPDSRGHTPAPASALARLNQTSETPEESQSSINTSNINKKGRMEIPIDPESDEVRVDQLAEYQWQGSELCMIQEQVSLYLGVKSFKRKYPDLKRRTVEAEERTFLEDSGLVPKSMCDLGLTAVSSAEVLDVMYHDFPDKYEEFRRYMREKESREFSFKQKVRGPEKTKGESREQALEAAAMWNLNLNRERRDERRCSLDLQTFTVHYPKTARDKMVRPGLRPGLYPVPVIPGQFSDYYKTYTPTELMYFPLNTVMYGPLKPNERRPNHSDGSDSSSSSSDDSSCGSDSEDEESVSKECKICNGEKKTNSETHPEILLQCSQCKGLCHPTCQEITPEMLPHIKKYSWHCSNCKKCVQCKNANKDEKMLFCDLCDRGYHISCVGLKKSPESRWHCSVCSFCTICGSKDPGGAEWHYEYKKTEKGVRLYQRTLCVPCSKNALL